MPTYDYICPKCSKPHSDVRGIRDYDRDPSSTCPHCQQRCGSLDRDFSHCRPTFTGTAVVSAEFNPGLGAIVKNKYHKTEIMKRKGVVEVGNDFGGGEKMQKSFDKTRQEARDKAWEKI